VQTLPVVLVIEDDQLMQSLIEQTLTDGGFDVAIVATGEEAIALLTSKKVEYRALVTDIHLAGKLDGWDVARAVREIDPAFPVVYMSGAAADEWASKGVPNSIIMAKPFAPAQLTTAVAQLLNDTPPTAPTE
jgi:CheY-like chemotaxis protein